MKSERRERLLANIGGNLFYLAAIHPTQGKYGLYLASFFLFLSVVYIYLIYEMVKLAEGDLDIFINGAETVTIYFQGFKIPMLFYKNDLLRFLNEINLFWDGPDDLYLKKLFARSARILKNYRNLMIVVSGTTLFMPYFIQSCGFCFHVPNFPYSFIITTAIQTIHLTTNIWYVVGVDLLFAALCMNITGQFHLLNKTLSSLGDENDKEFKETLTKCIKHHNFLLSYCQDLNKTYGLAMFAQYLLSIYTVCLEIYKFFEIYTAQNMIQSLMVISAMTTQLALYCFPAYEVTIASEDTADAIYQSCWYNRKPALQKYVGTIIIRARQNLVFNGLGIMEMTRATYLTIFKSAFSFYTFLKQMKIEEE